eukprot:Selendium_serpulae@DN4482_c0_g1_i1.p2
MPSNHSVLSETVYPDSVAGRRTSARRGPGRRRRDSPCSVAPFPSMANGVFSEGSLRAAPPSKSSFYGPRTEARTEAQPASMTAKSEYDRRSVTDAPSRRAPRRAAEHCETVSDGPRTTTFSAVDTRRRDHGGGGVGSDYRYGHGPQSAYQDRGPMIYTSSGAHAPPGEAAARAFEMRRLCAERGGGFLVGSFAGGGSTAGRVGRRSDSETFACVARYKTEPPMTYDHRTALDTRSLTHAGQSIMAQRDVARQRHTAHGDAHQSTQYVGSLEDSLRADVSRARRRADSFDDPYWYGSGGAPPKACTRDWCRTIFCCC